MPNNEKDLCPLLLMFICYALLLWYSLWMRGIDTIYPFSDFFGFAISEANEWKEALFDISDFLLSSISRHTQCVIAGQKFFSEGNILFWLEIAINLMIMIAYIIHCLIRMGEFIFELLFFTEIAYVTRPLAIVYLGYKLRFAPF